MDDLSHVKIMSETKKRCLGAQASPPSECSEALGLCLAKVEEGLSGADEALDLLEEQGDLNDFVERLSRVVRDLQDALDDILDEADADTSSNAVSLPTVTISQPSTQSITDASKDSAEASVRNSTTTSATATTSHTSLKDYSPTPSRTQSQALSKSTGSHAATSTTFNSTSTNNGLKSGLKEATPSTTSVVQQPQISQVFKAPASKSIKFSGVTNSQTQLSRHVKLGLQKSPLNATSLATCSTVKLEEQSPASHTQQ